MRVIYGIAASIGVAVLIALTFVAVIVGNRQLAALGQIILVVIAGCVIYLILRGSVSRRRQLHKELRQLIVRRLDQGQMLYDDAARLGFVRSPEWETGLHRKLGRTTTVFVRFTADTLDVDATRYGQAELFVVTANKIQKRRTDGAIFRNHGQEVVRWTITGEQSDTAHQLAAQTGMSSVTEAELAELVAQMRGAQPL